MYQKILVAVDRREMALRALEHARDLAAAFDGELVLLHVMSKQFQATQRKRVGIVTDLSEVAETTQLLNQVAEVMAGSPVKYTLKTVLGYAADQILQVVENEKCDAIVMGSRGLSSMEKFFVGSVSTQVMSKAEVPVLIVK